MVVKLKKGVECQIDEQDLELFNSLPFYASKTKDGHVYAKSIQGKNGKRKSIYLHRLLLGAKRGQIVDHKNGNTLDNRRCNIRIVTASQNSANAKPRGKNLAGASKTHAGRQGKKLWTAKIQFNKKAQFIGYFLTEQEAHEAYKKKSIEIFGEHSPFARTQNEIKSKN